MGAMIQEKSAQAVAGQVKRRKVYYVSGFDPRGAAYYHRLYREESAKQAVHHDGVVTVSARSRLAEHVSAWNVDAEWAGHAVSTHYQFLHWDDLVRRHWEPSLAKLVVSALASYGRYMVCGAFSRLRKTFRGPFYSALYPLIYLFLLMMLATGCGVGVKAMLAAMGSNAWLAWAGGMAAGAALFGGGIALANRLAVFWLLQIYRFVPNWGEREPEDVIARVDAMADWVRKDLENSPCDEALVVGHSVGSIVAVSLAARLAQVLTPAQRRRVTLLTLGQCIPLLSLMPSAKGFRRDLQRLADARDLQWFDMNARADSLCFSQANPLDISGIQGAEVARPVAQVVRPFRMFSQQEFLRIKRSKQRLHFQYLMASALPNEYDYFRMTAGPSRIQPY
jgi:pimeloyl-ACP methyl ester carboxylesterase